MKHALIPFGFIGLLVVAMGSRAGLKDIDPPQNYSTGQGGIVTPYRPFQPPAAIAKPWTNKQEEEIGAYNNGLIGEMVWELSRDGKLSPETQRLANDVLKQCEAIKFNAPQCQ